MINHRQARPGFAVFYQQPHMPSPEYGEITSVGEWYEPFCPPYPPEKPPPFVHVRFLGDSHSKACHPRDLHWPPDFCKADRANPPGQPFGDTA